MMKNNTKTLKIISLLILLLSLNTKVCYAVTTTMPTNMPSSDNVVPEEPVDPDAGKEKGTKPDGDKLYEYEYRPGLTTAKTIRVNTYDLNGKSLMPEETIINPEDAIKAGTWIGVNVTEVHSASWNVTDFKVSEVKKKYECKYSRTIPGAEVEKTRSCGVSSCQVAGDYFVPFAEGYTFGCCKYKEPSASSIDTQSQYYEKSYNEAFTCPATATINGYTYNYTHQPPTYEEITTIDGVPVAIKNDLKEKAYEEAENMAAGSVGNGAAGKVKYMTNHSYYTEHLFNELEGTKVYEQPKKTGGGVSGTYSQEYLFTPSNICMNFKTSVVTYENECDSSNGEVKLENKIIPDDNLGEDVEIWHYFVPLDASSKAIFPLQIIPTGHAEYSYDDCKNYMENINDSDPEKYTQFIIPLKDPITGEEYLFDKTKTHQENLEILRIADGCQLAINIDIPIVQKFYNELDDQKTYKGFNFYYKPINIEEPFPNGISDVSLWSQWQEDGENDPDLSSSYDDKTYEATDIDASSIRNYNRGKSYSEWDNINLDGTSKFIDEFLTRHANRNDIYKLGCGLANSDPEVKSLYIEECDR